MNQLIQLKIVMFSFLFCYFTLGNAQELKLKTNIDNKTVDFLLMDNEIVKDSFQINRVNFYYHWFEQINDSLYLFIYEKPFYGMPNEVWRNQVIIYKGTEKLNVAFFSTKERTNNPFRPISIGGGRSFESYNHDFDFSKLVKGKLEHRIELRGIYELKDSIVYDTTVTILEYNFDSEKKVFYNKLDTIEGYYDYRIENNGEEIGYQELYISEIVPSIHIRSFNYSFIKGYWFFMIDDQKVISTPLNDIIPNNMDEVTKYPKSVYGGY